MYCARPVARRAPATVRIIPQARSASFFPQQFFPRAAAADFNSLFRALDDISSPRHFGIDNIFTPAIAHRSQSLQGATFAPKFDVQEHPEGYELRGELPGVDSNDLSVEFSDPQTLVIKVQTARQSSSGTPPQSVVAPQATEATQAETTQAEAKDDNSDAASTYSTGSYQKPSVEDEAVEAESSADAQARLTPTTSEPAVAEQPQEQQQLAKAQEQAQQPTSRYWVSERSVGSFQRSFKFASRIDQEAVKASLKNGILTITVPKAEAPQAKKINIE